MSKLFPRLGWPSGRALLSQAGWPLMLLLGFIPVVLWSMRFPLSDRFITLGIGTTSLGQITGLVGMVFFSLAAVLSTRLKPLENFFGGMNRVYIAHHQVGGIAFILLMLHPLFLMITYLENSWQSAALFLLPGSDWPINFGIAALLSLMALLILTYYIELPYQLWRFTHKFLGAALFFGGLHTFFIPSDISQDPALRAYMLTITGLGLVGYVYRTILGRFLVKRFKYILLAVKKINPLVIELQLQPAENLAMNFYPGQFVFISFHGKGIDSETHPFSISSVPTPAGFTLTVKALGDYTNWLSNIPVNTSALVEGPFGRFSTDYHPAGRYIWIAGGIGITPFLSMARNYINDDRVLPLGSPISTHKGTPAMATPRAFRHPIIDLYYCVSDESEAVYLSELNKIAEGNKNFRVIPWFSKTQGRLSADAIAHTSGDIHAAEIFVCGPPPMMLAIKKQLKNLGVASERIHSEEFGML